MGKSLIVILLAVVGATLLGCQGPMVPGAEVTEQGTVVFQATGSSLVAKPGDPLAMLEAKAAAETIAFANLVKKIKGAHVTGKVAVDDLMYSSQEATERVEGFISRVHVEFEQTGEDGTLITARAILEVPRDELHDLGRYVDH